MAEREIVPKGGGEAAPAGDSPPPAGERTWRVLLARSQPRRAALAVAAALAAGGWGYLLFAHWLPALAGTALILAAVSDFLLPVTYRLTREYAEARSLLQWHRIAWREVRRVYCGPGFVKLSPLERPGRLEAFRGVLLRWEGDPADLLAEVERLRSVATDEA